MRNTDDRGGILGQLSNGGGELMSKGKIDLHIHTKYSDGSVDLQELFDALHNEGVKVASITDHNTIEAYRNMQNVNTWGITLVRGIEVDVNNNGANLHILMYNYNAQSPLFSKYLDVVRKNQIDNFVEMLKELRQMYGLTFDRAAVQMFIEQNTYFDKVRLNNLLVELGVAKTPRDAFYAYTKPVTERPRLQISPQDFFKIAKDSGAYTSLAHPMRYMRYYDTVDELEEMVLGLKGLGLDAVEVFNNKESVEDRERFLEFARNNGLGVTGGSDYHNKISVREAKRLGKTLDQDLLIESLM